MFPFLILTLGVIAPFAAAFLLYQQAHHTWEYRSREAEIYKKPYDKPEPTFDWFKAAFASVVISGLMIGFECVTVVPAGHIGVQVTFGEVNQKTLHEGMHLVNPLSKVSAVDVRLVTTKQDNASAGTHDMQQVHTDIVVNYRLNGEDVARIYKEYGLSLEDRVIKPILSETFKAVTAKYTSEELITKREVVSADIKTLLAERLGKYGISVGDISLVNFGFSAEYQKAIEQKVIATQAKLKAEQDLARIEVEAKQEIAKAEGHAKAISIQTQAINSQGGASYVQLKAIEKWDGKLPTTQAGGVTPFINVK